MNNKTDYSFMKSGRGDPPDDNVDLLNIASLIVTFTQNAVQYSAIYVQHANRTEITKTDIEYALKNEVFHFLNRPDTLTKAREIKEELMDMDISDDEGEIDDEMVIDSPTEQFTKSGCTCNLCTDFHQSYEKWKTWTPTNDLEWSLKNNIDELF